MLSRTVELVAAMPVLLIVTFRPEFDPPWTSQPYVTWLPLNRLDHRDAAAIIERIAKHNPLSRAVVTEIIERTDGVPLFVEEMTKAVLEDPRRPTPTHRIGCSFLSLSVPATVQCVFDGTPRPPRLRQGHRADRRDHRPNFSLRAPGGGTGLDQRDLAAALDRLTDARLVFAKARLRTRAIYSSTPLCRTRLTELPAGPAFEAPCADCQCAGGAFPSAPMWNPSFWPATHGDGSNKTRRLILVERRGLASAERSANSEALRRLKRGLALLTTCPSQPSG